jgi:hypothetical protein
MVRDKDDSAMEPAGTNRISLTGPVRKSSAVADNGQNQLRGV